MSASACVLNSPCVLNSACVLVSACVLDCTDKYILCTGLSTGQCMCTDKCMCTICRMEIHVDSNLSHINCDLKFKSFFQAVVYYKM